MANLKDFATSTVVIAPSPATSGTSLEVESGEGSYFPDTPFYATVCPDNVLPTRGNAEKVLVTNVSSDVLTIVRAQGGTVAKNIGTGWRITNAVFAHDFVAGMRVPSGMYKHPNCAIVTNQSVPTNMTFVPFIINRRQGFDRVGIHVQTQEASSDVKMAIYSDDNGYPGELLLDAGTVDTSSTGTKTLTIDVTLEAGLYWLAAVSSNSGTLRVGLCAHTGGPLGIPQEGHAGPPGSSTTYYRSAYFSNNTSFPSTAPGGMSWDRYGIAFGLRAS